MGGGGYLSVGGSIFAVLLLLHQLLLFQVLKKTNRKIRKRHSKH